MNQLLNYEVAGVIPAAQATGLWVSTITFQAPDGLFGTSGAPSGTYANVSGLVGLTCLSAPGLIADVKVEAVEVKSVGEVMAKACRHVLMAYYSTIVAGWRAGWQAVVDGITYDILGCEPDSQATQIRLELQVATL